METACKTESIKEERLLQPLFFYGTIEVLCWAVGQILATDSLRARTGSQGEAKKEQPPKVSEALGQSIASMKERIRYFRLYNRGNLLFDDWRLGKAAAEYLPERNIVHAYRGAVRHSTR